MAGLSKLFDRHFQLCFVAFLLRDSEFLQRVEQDVQPEFFSDETLQRIVRMIKAFYVREKSAPSTLIFRELDKLHESGKIKDDLYKLLNLAIDDLFKYELQNRRYLLNEFDRFSRHRLISANLIPFTEFVEKGEFERAEELMKEMFTHRPAKDMDLGGRYSPDPTERVLRRLKEDDNRFWMLIPEVDAVVRGLLPGQLGIWQSQRSSIGKSAALVHLARSALFQKRRALVFTDEMSKDEYEDRLDQCIVGLCREDLWNGEQIYKKLSRLLRHGNGIWIKEFSASKTRLSDLRDITKMIESVHDFHPDILLIDSAENLAPETAALKSNLYAKGEEIFIGLKDWLKEDQLYGWTVMQSNRGATEKERADQGDVAGSIAKIYKADLVISINSSPEEQEAGITVLRAVKGRHDKARFEVQIRTDFSRMLFWTLGDEELVSQ